MPRKSTRKGRGRQRGRGAALDWMKKAANWVKTNVKDKKIISSVSAALQKAGVPYMDKVHQVSSDLGWGRRLLSRRKQRGGALKMAGGRIVY